MLVLAMAAVATLALITFAQAVQAQEPAGVPMAARLQIEDGLTEFRKGHFDSAAAHFQQAVEMAPQSTLVHMYLGTALGRLYVPGVDTPDNVRRGDAAIRQFKVVADADDARREYRLQAMKGIASLYLNMKRFDDAVAAYQRVIDTDPSDAEPYYSIGVLRWSEAYRQRMDLRAKLDLQPMDSLPPGPECVELRAKVESGVEDGMQRMKKALELRPDYDDAMAYMNLLYRERAEYECDDPQARTADLKTADEWVDLTMATKKRKAEHGTVVERPSTGTGGGGGGSSERPPRKP
jgi:tetratricopeptide (TPR) repeat protein